MIKNTILFSSTLFILLMMTVSLDTFSFAEENTNTTISPIDATIGVEKTTLTFSVPQDNSLPWGFVEGKIENHVPQYPVIIQIFDNNELEFNGNNIGAVHFAQTDVTQDGSYEYRFRVSDNQDGNVINFFEGQYTVKIFKVVYLNSDLNSI